LGLKGLFERTDNDPTAAKSWTIILFAVSGGTNARGEWGSRMGGSDMASMQPRKLTNFYQCRRL